MPWNLSVNTISKKVSWRKMLRDTLKDNNPTTKAFTDDELDTYLELSLSDANAWPTFTYFSFADVPDTWKGMIIQGARVMALYAQGLLEAGREFNITDNGIGFVPPTIGAYMQTAASSLMADYAATKEKIKGNVKPGPAGVGTFRVLAINPALQRLRHLREKRII